MLKKRISIALSLLTCVAGLLLIPDTSSATTVWSGWRKGYPWEYKIRVRRATPVYRVTIGKYDYLNRRHYFTTLHKGAIVRTKKSGNGGVAWWVTGGRFGTFKHGNPSNPHYMYSANWKSPKSFKILKTYKVGFPF